MALTSKITNTLAIPNEPGQTVTIRKLSHHQLMMALDSHEDVRIAKMTKFGESVKYLPDISNPDDKAKAEQEAAKPENRYDRLTVLRYGVVQWTYELPPEQNGEPLGVAELDEETATWLFDEIIAFSVRSKDEGKASASGSPPATDPAEGAGQLNSPRSQSVTVPA
jgi:hypothetical protein